MTDPTRIPDDADGAPETSEALRLWVVLSRTHQAVLEHVQADIVRHGLTMGEFAVLEVLHHKGPLLLGQIRDRILVSSGGITYLVDRLEEKGFVRRRDCREDRRARYADLTEAGSRLMERIFPEHRRSIERAMAGLDEDEKRDVREKLKALGRRAAALDPDGSGSGAGGVEAAGPESAGRKERAGAGRETA